MSRAVHAPQRGRPQSPSRRCALACGVGLVALAASPAAFAGGQIEEPLSDAVRSVLSTAVADGAPPVPVFVSTAAHLEYLDWLTAMSDDLYSRMSVFERRIEFLQTAWYEAHRAGLSTALVLGLIQVESNFRKFAVSDAGARGYMQVMPFWTRLIGDGDASKLFQMQTNLRYGCVILRHYLDQENGDLFMALGRYNGTRGQSRYPNAVLSASKRWTFQHDKKPHEA